MERWLAKIADHIVVGSPPYAEASDTLRRYSAKVVVIPFAIRDHAADADRLDIEMIRNQYPDKRIVYALGRLIYYKGFNWLVLAAKYLPDDYVVLIGGQGSLRKELLEQIKREGLDKKVVLVGRIPEKLVDAYMAACDIYCMSSVHRSEAYGMVMLEAMMHSKPIVATEIPGSGVPWVNAHGESGYNVPMRSPEAIAKAIRAICEDPLCYQIMSRKSRERYLEQFTIDKMVSRLVKLIQ